MSYCVLARTYRSHTFEEVVGQESIATTLKNAIESDRVHHGYLFTGTRGVGKTSMARILAKSLNCLSVDRPTVKPCCTCESCRAVAVGEDIDVVEIDAASNTGVDDIRILRSNASLRPARARFKIYIIDEVHMLSKSAFNALLKTLEEPPSHVKFILATTEAPKVPATIQSRCQRFDFRSISAVDIATHLQTILVKEKVEAEDMVLRRIARLANGSMRDALSLLDKLLSYGADRLSSDIVDELIPPPHNELAAALVDCVAKQDAAAALAALDRALQGGQTVERFCDHLIEHLRTLLLLRVCGEDTDLVDVYEAMRSTLFKQSKQFDAPTYVYMISLVESLRHAVKYSGATRALADAAVVRLTMSRQFTHLGDLITQLDRAGDGTGSPAARESSSKKKPHNKPDPGDAERTEVTSAVMMDNQPETVPSVGPREGVATAVSNRRSLTSAEWTRVAQDPLVMRVKEAFEGTILDVRPSEDPVSRADDDKAEARRPLAETTTGIQPE